MSWQHKLGDDERLQQISFAEVKPLTHENLAQLEKFFCEKRGAHETVNVRCESSRCGSCKHLLARGPKCVFCKQRLFEGQHYYGPLWNAGLALNEQFPQDQPQCIKVEGSHEQPRSHARAAQVFELSLLESKSLCVSHEEPQQAGQESDNSAINPIPREYCTQKCVLGLLRCLKLDAGCPNVSAHRQGLETDSHQISYLQLPSLLTSQLALDRNNGCALLGLGAHRGRLHSHDKHVIFRITLTSHGYTLIGKATQMSTVKQLKREKEAYLILRKMQGRKVPVLLGDLYFTKPWSLSSEDVGSHSGSEMVYMLLLSHAGRPIWGYETGGHNKKEIRKFRKVDMRDRGLQLEQDEIRSRNMLWNDELGRLMFIDFERADFSEKWKAVIKEEEGEEEGEKEGEKEGGKEGEKEGEKGGGKKGGNSVQMASCVEKDS